AGRSRPGSPASATWSRHADAGRSRDRRPLPGTPRVAGARVTPRSRAGRAWPRRARGHLRRAARASSGTAASPHRAGRRAGGAAVARRAGGAGRAHSPRRLPRRPPPGAWGAGVVVGGGTGRPLVYHGRSALAAELPTYVSGITARRAMGRLGRLLDAHVPRRADFCIAVTEDLGAHLRRTGVHERSLACIEPAGAPDELADGRAAAAEPGLVCYAGNLDGYQ